MTENERELRRLLRATLPHLHVAADYYGSGADASDNRRALAQLRALQTRIRRALAPAR